MYQTNLWLEEQMQQKKRWTGVNDRTIYKQEIFCGGLNSQIWTTENFNKNVHSIELTRSVWFGVGGGHSTVLGLWCKGGSTMNGSGEKQ